MLVRPPTGVARVYVRCALIWLLKACYLALMCSMEVIVVELFARERISLADDKGHATSNEWGEGESTIGMSKGTSA